MGFDNTATLPPVEIDPGVRKISVLHADATLVSGRCTEIGGIIEITGDANGAGQCQVGGSFAVHLDFSTAPDGLCTIFVTQRDENGYFASPPLEVQLEKDTGVCGKPTSQSATPFAAGSGTEADPYLVCTNDQLAAIGSNLDAHIRLENDVDVGDQPWSWFGTLNGTLDGNGFVIENLTYDSSNNPTGLFTNVAGTVKNLGVLDINIYSYCHVGGITGVLKEGGVIESCYTTGVLQSYSDAVGGLVGQNTGTIIDSFSTVDVTETGSYCAGGLVGVTDPAGTVRRSYATGQVAAFGGDRVGGLVGCNDGALEDSYALGTVPGNMSSTNVGGLVGKNTGTITNAYSVGLVRGEAAGGLVGANSGTVNGSYWNTETSGRTASQGGTGLGTAAMGQASSYDGWDFDNVWCFNENSPYPEFSWQ